METETPVGLHGGSADDFGVLLDNLWRARPSKKVVVQDATKDVVLEVLPSLLSFVDEDIHAIRIHEEHSMSTARSLLHVDWVAPVDVGARGNAVVIVVPERADIVGGVEPKGIRVLAQTIQVRIVWKVRPQAEILGFEDQRRS